MWKKWVQARVNYYRRAPFAVRLQRTRYIKYKAKRRTFVYRKPRAGVSFYRRSVLGKQYRLGVRRRR